MFRYAIAKGVELRLLEERHAEELFSLTNRSREHLRRWTPWIDSTRTTADSKAFIRRSLEQFSRGDGLVAGIWYNDSLAGVVSFDRISHENRSATIGYWIGMEYQKKGLMTRACEALIDYGFRELGLNRIEIWAAVDNLRSLAIPERLGFIREGTERQAQWLNDHFTDVVVYSMLRSEWRPVASPPII